MRGDATEKQSPTHLKQLTHTPPKFDKNTLQPPTHTPGSLTKTHFKHPDTRQRTHAHTSPNSHTHFNELTHTLETLTKRIE